VWIVPRHLMFVVWSHRDSQLGGGHCRHGAHLVGTGAGHMEGTVSSKKNHHQKCHNRNVTCERQKINPCSNPSLVTLPPEEMCLVLGFAL
jgi:hypothetical protein